MNLEKIREILNAGYPDDFTEKLIIDTLSKDEQVIPLIMDILAYERRRKKKILSEINFQLSRAHLTIEKPAINNNHFVENEIIKFYHNNKDQIGHCFANMDNYKKPEDNIDESFHSLS